MSRPEVKKLRSKRQREYSKRPEAQERIKDYRRRPDVQERYRNHRSNRNALNQSVRGTHTSAQIQEQLMRQKRKCYYCHDKFKRVKDKYVYHVDHTFPLSRIAGTDIPANSIDYLVLTCPACNLSKSDKFPWEWSEGGRLL